MNADNTQRIIQPQPGKRQTKKSRFRSFLKVAALGLGGIAIAVGLLKLEDCFGKKKACQIKCRDDQKIEWVLRDKVKAEGLIGPGKKWKRVGLPSVCRGEDDPNCSEGKVPVCVDKPKPPPDPCKKNGICEPGETKKNCPSDCVDCNGKVISKRDKKKPRDCKKNEVYNAKTCGCDKKGQPPPDPCKKNGICEPGETKKNCPSDCVDCNGKVISKRDKKSPRDCKPNEKYNKKTCKCDPKEHPPDPCRKNGVCETGETKKNCPSDCVDCNGTVISFKDKKNPSDCNTNEIYNNDTCKCDPKPQPKCDPKAVRFFKEHQVGQHATKAYLGINQVRNKQASNGELINGKTVTAVVTHCTDGTVIVSNLTVLGAPADLVRKVEASIIRWVKKVPPENFDIKFKISLTVRD